MPKDPNQTEKSKERIKWAAINEFAEVGFYQAKISNIVAKAGFSQRTFYIYYENKEAIYREILEEWKTGLTSLFDIGKNDPDYVSAITTRWKKIFNFMISNPECTRVVYLHNPFIEEIRQELSIPLKQIMMWEKEQGFVREGISIDLLVEAHLALFEGLGIRYLLKGEDDYMFLAKQMSDIFINGAGSNKFKLKK